MGNSNVFKRNAGILMAISSLPSPYGIGTLGKDAYELSLIHILSGKVVVGV